MVLIFLWRSISLHGTRGSPKSSFLSCSLPSHQEVQHRLIIKWTFRKLSCWVRYLTMQHGIVSWNPLLLLLFRHFAWRSQWLALYLWNHTTVLESSYSSLVIMQINPVIFQYIQPSLPLQGELSKILSLNIMIRFFCFNFSESLVTYIVGILL